MKRLFFIWGILPLTMFGQNSLIVTEEKQGIIAYYQQHPLDINQVGETELIALSILSPSQIAAFLSHRKQIGRFVSRYELQSIPLWETNTLRMIQTLLVCRPTPKNGYSPENPHHQVLFRSESTIEQKKGYSAPTSRSKIRYLGNPWNHVFRFRGSWNSSLRGGLFISKDAGEVNFADFKSGFLAFNDPKGRYKWILGDFINQWGQGLIQSGSFSLGKSYESIRATQKFHGGGLPYTSSGEAEFYRGINLQHTLKLFQSQIFVSLRKKDLVLSSDSSYFQSFQLDGYHRTASELKQKDHLNEFVMGGNIRYVTPRIDISYSQTYTRWNFPFRPSNPLDWRGNELINNSLSYLYLPGNLRITGEIARTNPSSFAFLHAMSLASNKRTDLSAIFRYYQSGYFSPMSNAFRESSSNKNELGIYVGHQYQMNKYQRLSSYVDLFRFPSETQSQWLARKWGFELLSRFQWDRRKKGQYFIQGKWTQKAREDSPYTLLQASIDWSKKYHAFEWHGRFMWVHLRAGKQVESGYLSLHDIDTQVKQFKIQVRSAWIWSASYDTRLYAYEPSLPYAFLLPAYYDPSFRHVLLVEYKGIKRISMAMKIARTDYLQKDVIGSSLESISGSHKTDLGIQLVFSP